jgi:hypothetical protein
MDESCVIGLNTQRRSLFAGGRFDWRVLRFRAEIFDPTDRADQQTLGLLLSQFAKDGK